MTGPTRATGVLLLIGAVALTGASVHAQPAPDQPDLEARLARLERLLESEGLIELMLGLDQLQAEVRQLRGELELQAHTLEDLQRRQRELYLDVDRRLRPLETGAPMAPAPPSAELPAEPPALDAPVEPPAVDAPALEEPGPAIVLDVPGEPPAPQPPSASPVDPAAEQAAYHEAFELLKEGQYDRAAEAFEGLLARNPEGRFADNAQYWLGEARYVTRDFETALREFGTVLERYPTSSKAPDALLKIGFAHYELGRWEQARESLAQVVERYPASTAARLAENRLQRMRSEGR
jgi:tol-pal system protein YbgF